MAKSLLIQWFQPGESIAAAATRWSVVGASVAIETGNTEANIDRPIRDAVTIRKLLARVKSVTMTGNSTLTLRRNGADSSLIATIGTSDGDYEDAVNSQAFPAGDTLAWKSIGGTGTSFVLALILAELDWTTDCVSPIGALGASSTNLSAASTTSYFFILGGRIVSTTEADRQYRIKESCTWSDLGFQVGTCARTTDVNVVSRIDGVNGNQAITATGGDDSVFYEDTTNSDTLLVDDEITVSFTTGTGTENWNVEWIVSNLIATSRFFLGVAGPPERFNAGLTRYWPLAGSMTSGEESSEAAVAIPAPFDFTLEDLVAKCSASSGLIDSTIRSRVNGANGNLIVSFVDGEVLVKEDTTNSDSIAAGVDANLQLVTVNGTSVDFAYVGTMGQEDSGATLTPGGIASAEVFGSSTLTSTLTPSGISTTEAFGSAVVNVALLGSGIASVEAFGAALISPTVVPSSIATAEAFGTAVVSSGVFLAPDGIASAEAFGAAVLNLSLPVISIPSGENFSAPNMSPTLSPGGISTTEAFGSSTILGSTLVTPAGVATAEAFGAPLLALALAPAGIVSAEAFGSTVLFGDNVLGDVVEATVINLNPILTVEEL